MSSYAMSEKGMADDAMQATSQKVTQPIAGNSTNACKYNHVHISNSLLLPCFHVVFQSLLQRHLELTFCDHQHIRSHGA